MNNQKLLDPVWTSYQTTMDCLKIADRGVTLGELRLLANTRFIRSEADEAKRVISQSKDDAGDFVILSLWAVFERILVQCLRMESRLMLRNPAADFNSILHDRLSADIEYWKATDMLDLFRPLVNEELIMQAKQIKKYRDWIAHKNPSKPAPTNVVPQTAYKILSLFVEEIVVSSE
jgi:hypothetical protein